MVTYLCSSPFQPPSFPLICTSPVAALSDTLFPKRRQQISNLYRNGIHSHLPVHVGSVFNYINTRTNARRLRNVRLFPYTSRYIAMTAPPLTLFNCAARLLGMGKPDAVVFFEPAIVLLNNQIIICLLRRLLSLPRFERLP